MRVKYLYEKYYEKYTKNIRKIFFLQMYNAVLQSKIISKCKNVQPLKNLTAKVPAPAFKKSCHCTILSPPFLIFQVPLPPRELIEIHSPPVKKGGVQTLTPSSGTNFKMFGESESFSIYL